jgi:hypothetical protein
MQHEDNHQPASGRASGASRIVPPTQELSMLGILDSENQALQAPPQEHQDAPVQAPAAPAPTQQQGAGSVAVHSDHPSEEQPMQDAQVSQQEDEGQGGGTQQEQEQEPQEGGGDDTRVQWFFVRHATGKLNSCSRLHGSNSSGPDKLWTVESPRGCLWPGSWSMTLATTTTYILTRHWWHVGVCHRP